MRLPTRNELFQAAGYILNNFAVPIVFYITFRAWGDKYAIGFAIGVTAIQLLVCGITRLPVSPFFMIAAIFTVGFGGIDLLIPNPKFFRLEPFVQNLVVGAVFMATLFTNKPIIGRFADALPKRVRPDLSIISPSYVKRLTLLWVGYLWTKSIIFLYLALKVDLGSLIVLRPLIGGGTLFLMIAGEIIYRKLLYRGLPSPIVKL